MSCTLNSCHIQVLPTMGNCGKLSKDEWAAWTGGKPNHTWTDLGPKAPTEITSPNQLRPLYASSAQKGHNYRKMTGLETKFDKSDDLLVFINSIWDHLVDAGMDSIAYLPDPVNATKMVILSSRTTLVLQSSQPLRSVSWQSMIGQTINVHVSIYSIA